MLTLLQKLRYEYVSIFWGSLLHLHRAWQEGNSQGDSELIVKRVKGDINTNTSNRTDNRLQKHC